MKKRVISAVVALIIFVPLVILGGMWLKVAACVLGVLAMKEFLSLPHKNKRPMYVDIIIYALTILLIFMDGKREIYTVSNSEYENTSIGDSKRICRRKSALGLEYSTIHD